VIHSLYPATPYWFVERHVAGVLVALLLAVGGGIELYRSR
jgi:hypothetical protein